MSDESALTVLLQESTARIEAAAAKNTALEAEHAAKAAAFSVRAEGEIARMKEEQEKLAKVQHLRADIIRDAEEERDAISAEVGTMQQRIVDDAAAARLAREAAEADYLAKAAAAERELHGKLEGMQENWRERERVHRAQLEAHTAEVDAGLAKMRADHQQQIDQSKEQFAEEIAAKEGRLVVLEATEHEVQRRAAELAGDGTKFVELSVSGTAFSVSLQNLAKHPQSTLAVAAHSHISKELPGSVLIDGDPSHFNLVCSYLRKGVLPVTSGGNNELQWLEAEAAFYNLDELMQLCKKA